MKPLTYGNISTLGYIGLFILFMLPYVGAPALFICAFMTPAGPVRSFARAVFCLSIIAVVVIAVAVVVLAVLYSGGSLDYEFPLLNNDGLEAFRGILNIA